MNEGTMGFDAREAAREEARAAKISEVLKRAQARDAELRKHVSPPGALPWLPPRLEQRRLEYQIPDEAFARQALFDKVHIFQIPMWSSETYGDTGIVMPDVGAERMEESAPRGIIISAGLQALDVLYSNGSGLGHRVQFQHMTPWRAPYAMFGGKEFYILPMRVGDLINDEDAVDALRHGAAELVFDKGQHKYRYADGDAPTPVRPKIRGDI